MKRCSLKICGGVALALSLLLVANTVTAQELLVNPGFEDTNTDNNFGDGWGSFGAAGFNAFFGPNGHASLFADNIANTGGVFQIGIAGAAGQAYRFELSDTRIESDFDANLEFGLEFYQGDDATKISETFVQIPDPGVEINGGVYDMTAVAPAGTVFVRPVAKYDNVGSSGGQHNVFVFDASLTAVPEPTALAMVLISGVMGAVTRRRRS